MNTDLDVWAIQYYPEELYTALSKITGGISIIYSNCICDFTIDHEKIKSRQFDTVLYNEESDVLIMLMRGGKATKEQMIEYLENNNLRYGEVSLIEPKEEYEDKDDVPEIWFVRESAVLEDAFSDSVSKGISECECFPLAKASIDFLHSTTMNGNKKIDGRACRGIIVVDDKIIMLINQRKNIDEEGKSRNMNIRSVLNACEKTGMSCNLVFDRNPDIYSINFSSRMLKK